MKQPNWFDKAYSAGLEKATAEQALAEIAKSQRVVEAVRGALAEHDKNPNMPGPSRTQVIRQAIVEALDADA
ncbi:MAG: hypothetical protein K2X82_17565 [Gemmataceae bacterium]|nr:hypothetical protein [Gemmataceae bacterium]